MLLDQIHLLPSPVKPQHNTRVRKAEDMALLLVLVTFLLQIRDSSRFTAMPSPSLSKQQRRFATSSKSAHALLQNSLWLRGLRVND